MRDCSSAVAVRVGRLPALEGVVIVIGKESYGYWEVVSDEVSL